MSTEVAVDAGSVSLPDQTAITQKDRLELARAQAEASRAVVREIGEAVKVVVETPALSSFLTDAGKAIVLRFELDKLRTEKDHELRMQANKLAHEAAARREKLGVVLISVGFLVVVAAVVTVGVLVQAGVIEKGTALAAVGSLLTLTLGAVGGGRIAKATKKSDSDDK